MMEADAKSKIVVTTPEQVHFLCFLCSAYVSQNFLC